MLSRATRSVTEEIVVEVTSSGDLIYYDDRYTVDDAGFYLDLWAGSSVRHFFVAKLVRTLEAID